MVVSLWVAAIGAAPVAAQELSYIGGLQGATGDYVFGERTSSAALFTGLSLSVGRLSLMASIPVIAQTTPWVSYSGVGPLPTGGPQSGSVRDWQRTHGRRRQITIPDTASYSGAGIGDPVGLASLELVRDQGAFPSLRITGGIKAPVADVDRGFGTGAWDYGGGLSLGKSAGRTMLLASAMYWSLGDLPDLVLRDVVSYGATVARSVGEGRLALMATASGSTSSVAGTDGPIQLGGGVSYRWPSGRSMMATATFGVTNTAPDASLYVGWQVPLWRAGPTVERPTVALTSTR